MQGVKENPQGPNITKVLLGVSCLVPEVLVADMAVIA